MLVFFLFWCVFVFLFFFHIHSRRERAHPLQAAKLCRLAARRGASYIGQGRGLSAEVSGRISQKCTTTALCVCVCAMCLVDREKKIEVVGMSKPVQLPLLVGTTPYRIEPFVPRRRDQGQVARRRGPQRANGDPGKPACDRPLGSEGKRKEATCPHGECSTARLLCSSGQSLVVRLWHVMPLYLPPCVPGQPTLTQVRYH